MFILLLVSAMISAAEIALFSLRSIDKNERDENESSAESLIASLSDRSDNLLATLRIWNNFANVSIVLLTTYAFYQFIDFSNARLIGFFAEIILLTFLILLFGETIPAIYAQNNAFKFIKKIAPLLDVMEKITRPFSFLLLKSSFSTTIMKKKSNDVSVDELSKALELTSNELPEEKDMLKGIISLYNKTVVEIMTPRMDVADLDVTTGFKKVISYIVDVSYSRIPVYSGNQDDIRGILYIKDLLPYLDQPDSFHWQKLIRPAFFVPETKKIDDLLEEFRTNKIHMAVVVDEFGGTSGIVTMEDILEEIVGEINDEYDEEETKFTRLADGSYIFDAKILLIDFFRATGLDSKTFGKLTDDVDTIAGLVLEIKGDFPEHKEIVRYENYAFQVLEMDKKRIFKIKFNINRPLEKKYD
ncbi:MAG: gliding motility-associated protein GldE [Dysgonamonadaceae bacterium]|jgi:gliding motility-associated protein GldE|nr:gliding motility-associated protein GldE [Dysgonamonadaceae bacterium]